MKQKEIWLADLDPVKGHEQAGKRPIVILSGNALNDNMPILLVAPLSSKIKNYKGNPILIPSKLNGLINNSELIVFQFKAITKERLLKKMGYITESEFEQSIKTLNDLIKY